LGHIGGWYVLKKLGLQINPTWEQIVERDPLIAFSHYLCGRVHVLFAFADEISINLDEGFSGDKKVPVTSNRSPAGWDIPNKDLLINDPEENPDVSARFILKEFTRVMSSITPNDVLCTHEASYSSGDST
jgi:hypothetical protein